MTHTPDTDLIQDSSGNTLAVTLHRNGQASRIVINALVFQHVEEDEDEDDDGGFVLDAKTTQLALTPDHAVQLAHKILQCAAWAGNLFDTGDEKGNTNHE